jgi:hypothetical protein
MKNTRLVLLTAALCVLLVACVPGANEFAGDVRPASGPPGFWKGLWHGFIAPVTFVISLFSSTVGMYEVRNNGGWYDFGYLIGLGMLHGGGAAGRHARRRRRRD